MASPIYYLAHPYSNDPLESFKNAQRWTYTLRRVGFYPFSPILHTHPYYDTMTDNFGMFGEPVGTVEELTNYMNTEDWLDWDLKIIEGFMNHDGREYHVQTYHCRNCEKQIKWKNTRHEIYECTCGERYNKHINMPESKISNEYLYKKSIQRYYDSGVIVLLSHTAFKPKEYIKAEVLGGPEMVVALEYSINWLSQGCRQEYEFAKSHHIRVLELESFLEGKEVDL